MAEVHDGLDPTMLAKMLTQWLSVICLHPLVCHDEREATTRTQNLQTPLEKVDIDIRCPVIRLESLFPVRLVFFDPLLANVRRIGDDHIETTGIKHLGKLVPPFEGFGIEARIINDAVADADCVVEAC